jgi:hypothetical protein
VETTDCGQQATVVIAPISADSLRKTGIFGDVAGDFQDLVLPNHRFGSLETKPNARKAGISGPILASLGGTWPNAGMAG